MDSAGDGRSHRNVSSKKSSRLAALDKLNKRRKGLTEDKYDIKEEEDVYMMVDEDEYSELVHQRQKDDWIVDDDGIGEYVEDGREIFDDYEDDGNECEDNYRRHGKGDKKKKNMSMKDKSETKPDSPAQKRTIKNYFLKKHATLEKKTENFNLDDDALLSNIIEDINNDDTEESEPISQTSKASLPMKLKKKANFDPSASFSESFSSANLKPKPIRRVAPKRKADEVDDFESFLDKDFIKEVEASSKKVKIEPVEEFTPDSCADDFAQVGDDDDHDDWTSGIEMNVSSSSLSANPILDTTNEEIFDEVVYAIDNNGTKYLKMYWIDAHEDPTKYPGRVYLFGKILMKSSSLENKKNYASCCIIIEKVERRIYLLPKQNEDSGTSINDVKKEFNDEIAPKFGIKTFKSKKVTKQYSFEHTDVPYHSDYLEVIYPANHRQLPIDLKGKTFSRIFGTTQSALERMILDLKLMGPCWINVREPQAVNVPISWCKKEFTIDFSFKNFEIDSDQSIPPLTVCSINLKTFSNHVVAVSCLTKVNYEITSNKSSSPFDLSESFCSITRPVGHVATFPYNFEETAEKVFKKAGFIKKYENEQFMLNQFLVNLGKIDPDVIVGHDISFDLSCILNRQSHYNDKINWSRLGRLRRTGLKDVKSQKEKQSVTAGRILCDIKTMAKEFCRLKSYELDELVKNLLKKERVEGPTHLPSAYVSSKSIMMLLNSLLYDNRFILEVLNEVNILPLAIQITKLAGNLLSRTLMGGRAERNEYLLLHAFNEKNFILPDKINRKYTEMQDGEENVDSKSKKKAAYAGGLVLEPKVGFYDSFILLMDFNSLYPSIIQEYNICFTTVSTDKKKLKIDENGEEIPEVVTADPEQQAGILPTEIRKLVEERREVKNKMKDPKFNDKSNTHVAEYKQLDIKQTALKLTANSMYGCLGFTNSRFYAKPLAALITFKGREILMKTKMMVESMNLEVIYGDTDSIMINTIAKNFDEVMSAGFKIQAEINRIYKKLEIGIDGVYRPMLLLKKKKYAAVSISEVIIKKEKVLIKKVEMKGLDIVRRDWSQIAKDEGEKVVKIILGLDDKPQVTRTGVKEDSRSVEDMISSIHSEVRRVADFIRAGEFDPISLKKFEIVKQLTRNPEDYPDKKHLVHVNVATRRNADPKVERKFRAGDVVAYVICINPADAEFNALPATQRAFHPEELKDNPNLKIDADYYLSQQIHPVLSRLCEPLEGTDAHILGELLGIETANIHRRQSDDQDDLSFPKDESTFDRCSALSIKCPSAECGQIITTRSPFKIDEATKRILNCSLSRCSFCKCDFSSGEFENRIFNSFVALIRDILKNYYKNWMSCACGSRTQNLLHGYKDRDGLTCPKCQTGTLETEKTDDFLHKQFKFFEFILDIDSALESITSVNDRKEIETKSNPMRKLYSKLLALTTKTKNTMAYTDVDLAALFKNQIFFCVRQAGLVSSSLR